MNTPRIIDKTMSVQRANLIAALLMIPAYLLATLPFVILWGRLPALSEASLKQLVWILALFILGIVFHEGLHALGYRMGGATRQEIRFGFKYFSPYAHCQQPLKLKDYRRAVALPGLILGIAPGLLGLALGNDGLTLFAAIMLIAATGDALILWMLRDAPPEAMVQDHPTLMGCQLLID